MAKGNGYIGSSAIETSVAGKNIIPSPPPEKRWTYGYKLYKFSFSNEEDCTVVVNAEVTIFLKAGQGFETNDEDYPISSFAIKESGKKYNWIGGY